MFNWDVVDDCHSSLESKTFYIKDIFDLEFRLIISICKTFSKYPLFLVAIFSSASLNYFDLSFWSPLRDYRLFHRLMCIFVLWSPDIATKRPHLCQYQLVQKSQKTSYCVILQFPLLFFCQSPYPIPCRTYCQSVFSIRLGVHVIRFIWPN